MESKKLQRAIFRGHAGEISSAVGDVVASQAEQQGSSLNTAISAASSPFILQAAFRRYDSSLLGAIDRSETVGNITLNEYGVHGAPIVINVEDHVLDEVGCQVMVAGAASSSIRFALYNFERNEVGNLYGTATTLIADLGTVAADTTGVKSVMLGTKPALNPGHYWLCVCPSAGSIQVKAFTFSSHVFGWDANSIDVRTGTEGYFGEPTYSNLPSDLGNPGYSELAPFLFYTIAPTP